MNANLVNIAMLMVASGLLGFFPVESGKTEEPIRFSGIHTVTRDEAYAVPVAGTTNHVLRLIKSSGTNKSTGATAFLDGATETEVVYGDDTEGSGPHHGYIFYIASDGTLLNEFDGYGTTFVIEGKPRFIGGGSWHTVGGTGRYEGGIGFGTYRSESSKTEWEGTFTKR